MTVAQSLTVRSTTNSMSQTPSSRATRSSTLRTTRRPSQVIASVLTHCADDSWKLKYGDIVYIDTERTPSKVSGSAMTCVSVEVRVREMDEAEGVGTNGRWVRTDCCHKWENGDLVHARDQIIEALVRSGTIFAGTTCVYDGMYSDDQVKRTLYGSGHSSVILWRRFYRARLCRGNTWIDLIRKEPRDMPHRL